jgi:hypothetical protein
MQDFLQKDDKLTNMIYTGIATLAVLADINKRTEEQLQWYRTKVIRHLSSVGRAPLS